MKNVLVVILAVFVISSCKKEEDTIGSFDFIYKNTVDGLNDTVFFSAVGDFESVTWDFGDGSTAEGIEVYHIYSSFDCFSVSATAKKGSATKQVSKNVSVTKFKRFIVSSVEVLQIPLLAGNGQDFDPNDDPDLVLKLQMPDDSIYQCPITISNSRTGNFILSPPQETNLIGQTIKFYLYDRDNGSVPDLYSIGSVGLNTCPPIPNVNSTSYVDSVTISGGSIRLEIKYTWGI
jgi:hypothetical protein